MSETQTEQTLEALYQFIRSYIEANGHPPSLREISSACYLGRSTVIRYLDKLEARGRITRKVGKARGIHVIEKG